MISTDVKVENNTIVGEENQVKPKNYGVIMYDIPQGDPIRNKIIRYIAKRAFRINLSIWLFNWGLYEDLAKKVKEWSLKSLHSNIKLVKFDNESKYVIEEMAKDEFIRLTYELKLNIEKRRIKLNDAIENNDEEKDKIEVRYVNYLKNLKKKLIDLEAGATTLALIQGDCKKYLEQLKVLFKAEYEAVVA